MVSLKSLYLLAVALCVLSSCGKPSQNGDFPAQHAQDNNLTEKQMTTPKLRIDQNGAVAAHLEMLASRIPQVISANCVIFGNTAVVGLNLDGRLDSSRVGIIK